MFLNARSVKVMIEPNHSKGIIEMSLAEWQISLISGSVGAVIPFIFVFVREWRTERKRRAEIRDVLCSELVLLRETLTESLETGKPAKDNDKRLLISDDTSIFESFPLDTAFYDDVAVETLAKSVNIEVLKALRLTYNMIYHFNTDLLRMRVIGGYWTEKETVSNLISQIERTTKLVKDC